MANKTRERAMMFVLMTFFFLGYGAALFYGLNWALGLTWTNVIYGGIYWVSFTSILLLLAFMVKTKEGDDDDDGGEKDPSAEDTPPPSADEIEEWVNQGADKHK